MSKRENKESTRMRIKNNLLNKYGCRCMICEDKFTPAFLSIHSINKYEFYDYIFEEDCGVVCIDCKDTLKYAEKDDIKTYQELNHKISHYKLKQK